MTFESTFLEPSNGDMREGITGVYALPIAANLQNSGDRLQTMVDRLRIPFLISDLLGQNRKRIFDMSAKAANQPDKDQFRSASLWRADFLYDRLEGHSPDTVIGFGDSLGVPAIQGIQFHTDEHERGEDSFALFDAILLRDGWNLSETNSKLRNLGHYIGYTIKDTLQQKRSNNKFDITKYGYEDTANWPDETNFLQKIGNVADLMGSPMNRDMAIELAGMAADDNFGMNVVCLENGLSGNTTEQYDFKNSLKLKHARHLAYPGSAEELSPLYVERFSLRAEMVPGWHSDLLDPERAAQEVENTLALMR